MSKTVEISGAQLVFGGYTYSCVEETTGAILQLALRWLWNPAWHRLTAWNA